MQLYTVYFVCKLLYMFRVVSPPIIRSTSNCMYKISNILRNVSKCPTRCTYTQFILSVNCSTRFGWFLRPSSGAQITVCTASGTSQPLLMPVTIVEEFTDNINCVQLHLVGHLLTFRRIFEILYIQLFVLLMMGGETTRNVQSSLQIK